MADSSSHFGANYWLVDEIYREYLADPDSVGESWKEFFSDYRPMSPSLYSQLVEGNGAQEAASSQAAPAAPAKTESERASGATAADEPEAATPPPEGAKQIRGVGATIAENMVTSLGVPTATSMRDVPAKLLEVNRNILNRQLKRTRGGKVSFTHLIAWAVVRALVDVPVMSTSYHESDGKPFAHRPDTVNLGLAMDMERPDGSRTLLVPNIKNVHSMDFADFFAAYEDVVRKVRDNKLSPELFADTTLTLTNPGTVGTVGSVPRLMSGQSAIIGVGAINYPAEYAGADQRTLAQLAIGKVITLSSTYDHRVIQGAESGIFLQRMHQLLLGDDGFYDGIFRSLRIPYEPVRWHSDDHIAQAPMDSAAHSDKQIAIQKLINAYRVRGHLIANLNPLSHTFQRVHPELDPATYGLTIWDLDRFFATGGLAGKDRMKLGLILGVLRDAYCRTIGVEYMHIQEPEQKAWIQKQIEGVAPGLDLDNDTQKQILSRLNAAEAFEKFLHTKYLGHKRFSLEGAETAIPMLATLLDDAADAGIGEAVMGMAHRGRLNVLANIMHKSYDKIFREFEGDIDPDSIQGSGDVKYHLGTDGTHLSPDGNAIDVYLASNPSHLEAVDPVVQGMARARLDVIGHGPDRLNRESPVLPILIHGDAAFAGQGVVAETFAMSQLRGYRTGGTVHLVINNQVGFTTSPHAGRSSQYSTDVAKMVQAPIFHVNGDDPEAAARVMELAFAFRQEFGKDVVVDLVCYRRHGHNEGDDPSYTQPVMYRAIEQRRSVRKLYTEELVNRGDLTLEDAEKALDDFRSQLEQALSETRDSEPPTKANETFPAPPDDVAAGIETGVPRERLEQIVAATTSAPEGFNLHPKLARQMERRSRMLEEDAVDWAMGEAFAVGSLVLEGTPVRLAGQDSRRGTFSHRHSVFADYETGAEHTPLANLSDDQAKLTVYDSPLSEYAAMGFDYGYSAAMPEALVMWEAQFGDFVNGAQIVIDQFLVAAEDKWQQESSLVLLLPHGYEGQGPEHSSGRMERFLELAAYDNIQVAQPTNAAQYFHLLRRQMHRELRKPLVIFTPKGLLRAKPANSRSEEFTSGSFAEVLDDPGAPESVERVLLCSGKIAYELMEERDEREAPAAVIRLEQLYPFPQQQVADMIEQTGATQVTWVQDEPENMGPWPFMYRRLHEMLDGDVKLRHVTRRASGSPATGSATIHEQEAAQLMDGAFEGL